MIKKAFDKRSFSERHSDKSRSRRLILVGGNSEKNAINKRLLKILREMEIEYTWGVSVISFYLPFGKTCMSVYISSTIGEYWKKIPDECGSLDEIVYTPNAFDDIVSRGNLDCLHGMVDTIKNNREETYSDFLQVLLRNKGVLPIKGFETDKTLSISKDFHFPLTLYREGMEEYFSDKGNPTQEEFLLALMMENVHGRTEIEKEAIKEATLHCKGKGI